MAQLRQDYDAFIQHNTAVIAVGPDTQEAFKAYWKENDIPFIGLADPDHNVAKLYEQEVNLLKFGRVPAQMIVDQQGMMPYVHYSRSMSDIPKNQAILDLLDNIHQK